MTGDADIIGNAENKVPAPGPDGLYRSKKGKIITEAQARARANLKPIRPGEVRNPKGRPKGKTIAEWLRSRLDQKTRIIFDKEVAAKGGIPKRILGQPVGLALTDMAIKEALKGDLSFLRFIVEYTEGAPVQRLAGHDGGPLDGGGLDEMRRMMANPEAMAHMQALAKLAVQQKDAAAKGGGQ